jgi:hypothetical protein
MTRTTINVPENVIVALRKYMASNNMPLREQSKVVEAALKRFFENHDIDIDNKDDTITTFAVQGGGMQKISVSIRANLLKALQMYIAYQGLTQHDQSRVTVAALREFLEVNGFTIDDANKKVLKFDVEKEEWV